MSKTLIAFYSRAGENYFGGAMRHIAVGNTKVAAEMLQEITKGICSRSSRWSRILTAI